MKALREQIAAVVPLDAPMSVRHVFYRMTDPTLTISSLNGRRRLSWSWWSSLTYARLKQ